MAVTLHTSLGDLKIELYCEEAPKACENFLALAASKTYDDTIFHRLIPTFMIQGGDPTGTGRGGRSVFKSANGKFGDELSDSLKHNRRGVVSMANSGPNTNGSQFFITFKAQPSLNGTSIASMITQQHNTLQLRFQAYGKYTIFGHVIDGMEVLDQAEKQATDGSDRPLRPIKLISVTIHANPLA